MRILWISVSPLKQASFSVVTDNILKRLGKKHEIWCLGQDYLGTPLQMENYVLTQFSDFRQLRKYTETLRPDVIIAYHAPFFLSRLSSFLDEVKKLAKIIIYTTVEGYPLTIDLSFLDKADLILVPSHFSQECLAKEGYKAEVLHHGVDTSIFRPLVSLEEKYAGNPLKLGTIASLTWRKQLALLIDAYALALSKGLKNAEYYLVTTTYDATPWQPDINIYAKKLGIRIKVSKTAYLNLPVTSQSVSSFYNSLHLHILPTSESFGLPNLEAMACGTVPIVIKHGAALEIVGDCGIYVEIKGYLATSMGKFALVDIDDLSEKIIWAQENRQHLKMLAEKGIIRAKMFTWEKTVTRINSILEALT